MCMRKGKKGNSQSTPFYLHDFCLFLVLIAFRISRYIFTSFIYWVQ